MQAGERRITVFINIMKTNQEDTQLGMEPAEATVTPTIVPVGVPVDGDENTFPQFFDAEQKQSEEKAERTRRRRRRLLWAACCCTPLIALAITLAIIWPRDVYEVLIRVRASASTSFWGCDPS